MLTANQPAHNGLAGNWTPILSPRMAQLVLKSSGKKYGVFSGVVYTIILNMLKNNLLLMILIKILKIVRKNELIYFGCYISAHVIFLKSHFFTFRFTVSTFSNENASTRNCFAFLTENFS